ncbi:uncharacterized protein RAG0_09542 [Rhynchosporium agropyri]|uniref:Uncharacterized protein n=1 Tax=Rhynchosporium agropyri TaxID=914238 RepID=A0A1E1KW00_9HELO|nr:uncharacterized protein RAG0_09542 [Rhynchosporium agropyri]
MGCPLFVTPKEPKEEKKEEIVPAQAQSVANSIAAVQPQAIAAGLYPRSIQVAGVTDQFSRMLDIGIGTRDFTPRPIMHTRIGALTTADVLPEDQEIPNRLDYDSQSNAHPPRRRQQVRTTFEPLASASIPSRPTPAATEGQSSNVSSRTLMTSLPDIEALRRQLEVLREQVDIFMDGRIVPIRVERGEEDPVVQLNNINASGNSRRQSGTQSRLANYVSLQSVHPYYGWMVSETSDNDSRLNDPTFPDFPHLRPEMLFIDLDRGLGTAHANNVGRSPSPPIRSAAPSPPLSRHVRSRHGADIHQHHPNCPCVDCWHT